MVKMIFTDASSITSVVKTEIARLAPHRIGVLNTLLGQTNLSNYVSFFHSTNRLYPRVVVVPFVASILISLSPLP